MLDGALLRDLHGAVRDAVRCGALTTCHDIAEGGLAVALAECCLGGGIGASVELADVGEAGLFGEAPGCAFIVAGQLSELEAAELPRLHVVGDVGGEHLSLIAGDLRVNLALSEMRAARDDGLAELV